MRAMAYMLISAVFTYAFLLCGVLGFASSSPCGKPCGEARDLLTTNYLPASLAIGFALLFISLALMIATVKRGE